MKSVKLKKMLTAVISCLMLCAIAVGFSACGVSFDPDREIVVVTRESSSGTHEVFLEKTKLTDREIVSGKSVLTSTGLVLAKVMQDPQAIGYISAGSVNKDVAALKVVNAAGVAMACTNENIKNGSYELSRPFNMLEKETGLTGWAADFKAFVLSNEGQDLVKDAGYVHTDGRPAYVKASGLPAGGTIKVGGSTSVEELVNAFIEKYKVLNPGVSMNYDPTGSGAGVTNAQSGAYDIGFSSRGLKASETGLIPTRFADDGIAVIVNKKNTIDTVKLEDITKIYKGEITKWSEIV